MRVCENSNPVRSTCSGVGTDAVDHSDKTLLSICNPLVEAEVAQRASKHRYLHVQLNISAYSGSHHSFPTLRQHLQQLHRRSSSPLRWKKLRWCATTCSAVSCAQSLTPLGKRMFLFRRVTSELRWSDPFTSDAWMTAGNAIGWGPSGKAR